MAKISLKKTSVAELWVDYTTTTDISNNQSTTDLPLKITTAANTNIGPWGDYNGSYFGTESKKFDGAIPNFSGTRTLATYKAIVNHNSEGIGTLRIKWKWGVNSSWGGFVIPSGEFDVPLPEIPRVTQPELSKDTAFIGDTVTITLDRALSTHKHDIAIYYGNKSLMIAEKVDTSFEWTIPESVAGWIPNNESMDVKLKAFTYENDVLNGSKSVQIVIKIPTSAKPTISSISLSESNSSIGDFGYYIQGMSQIKVETSAKGALGSTIKQIQSTIENVIYTGSEFTTNTIVNAGELSIKIEVTDSRGRAVSSTKKVTIEEYFAPQIISFKARRCDSAGNIKESGTYALVEYEYKIAPVGNKNAKNVVIKAKKKQDETYEELYQSSLSYVDNTYYLSGSIFSVDFSYDIAIELSDSFTSNVTAQNTILAERVHMEFLHSQVGMAVGKNAELPETFDIDLVTKFRKNIEFDNILHIPNGVTTKPIQIVEGDDLNNYTEVSGLYYCAGAILNRPIQSSGFLIVYANGENSIYQKFIALNGSSYERIKDSSGWTPWCGWYDYTFKTNQYWYQVYIGLDGRYEAFGNRKVSPAYSTQVGSMFESTQVGIALPLVKPDGTSLGVKLKEEPIVIFDVIVPNDYAIARFTTFNQSSGLIQCKVAKLVKSTTTVSTQILTHVIGKWK